MYRDELTVAELAMKHPEDFDYLGAMRLVTLFALRSGFEGITIRTIRGTAHSMQDVAKLDLSNDPDVQFTFGLHTAKGQSGLLDKAPSLSSTDREIADQLDRWIHLRRYALWLSQAYPTLACELEMAAAEHHQNNMITELIVDNPLGPLFDAIRLRAGLPVAMLADDNTLVACAWAIVIRNAAAIEQVLTERLEAPVTVLPSKGGVNRIRLRIEVNEWGKYLRLLPLGLREGLRDVVEIVRLIVGPQAEPELILVLNRHALPAQHEPQTAGYAGWTMFPVSSNGPPARDPEVFVSAADCWHVLRD